MTVLYNFSLLALNGLIHIASFFDSKAKLFVTGRKNLFETLSKVYASNRSPVVWIHCASLGEFEQGRPLIEALKREYPTHHILLTFFSPSGYEVRKNYPLADHVSYLPLDTAANARRFINTVNPVLAIFIKYEFWFHYVTILRSRNIPIISVSSIFRADQLFFKSFGTFYRNMLHSVSHFFVQNQESVRLLKSIGISNITLSGDTRFDRVHEIVQKGDEIAIAKNFKADQRVMVVGSCWQEDLDVLIPFINENKLKFIIAPHEISESTLTNTERALQVKSIRFSQAAGKNPDDYSVLLIDNVGMLSILYRYGEFAYIGGAFGKGLHNILEAACYGIPILFGNKNYQKFQEAVDLINRGGAFEVSDYPDLKAKYEMLNIPETFLLACEVTRQYVSDNLGATEKIMNWCRKVVDQKA